MVMCTPHPSQVSYRAFAASCKASPTSCAWTNISGGLSNRSGLYPVVHAFGEDASGNVLMGVGESGSCCQITKFNGTLWTTSTLNRFTFNNSKSSHVTRIVRDGFGNLYSIQFTGNGILYSTDSGATWNVGKSDTGPAFGLPNAWNFALDVIGNRLYFGGENNFASIALTGVPSRDFSKPATLLYGPTSNSSSGPSVTSVQITNNILTLTMKYPNNVCVSGAILNLSAFSPAFFLNGATVTPTSCTNTTITAPFTHVNYASTRDVGHTDSLSRNAQQIIGDGTLSRPSNSELLALGKTDLATAQAYAIQRLDISGTGLWTNLGPSTNITPYCDNNFATVFSVIAKDKRTAHKYFMVCQSSSQGHVYSTADGGVTWTPFDSSISSHLIGGKGVALPADTIYSGADGSNWVEMSANGVRELWVNPSAGSDSQ